MVELITLYTAKICPYAQRAEIALEEAGLPYKRYEIDLSNKPEWYAPKVNPASKVPAIAYGGPDVAPETPSPESAKIAESLVLLEFIADLSASTKPLLPADPVARARARFFIEAVLSKFIGAFYGALTRGEDPAPVMDAIDILQGLLPEEGYVVGEWSIADAAVTPFLARALVSFKHDIGAYDEGAGKKLYDVQLCTPMQNVSSRPSFKDTWHEDVIIDVYSQRFNELRIQRLAQK
ncbi:hypothetical protein D9611_012183 [Ephemerocybe angulata]|uniref:GST N-terminal domain-containing protein n=1 Tax=Ephemerocybe angulata TaxID=980116 RepID=A0A8H5FGD0_9AGAR|nr:hypothetical protein D9611_012183 [Tulosesus angulatus]